LISQNSIEDRAGAQFAVGHEGVAGDEADPGPAEAFVEALGVAAGDGIESEDGFASLARRLRRIASFFLSSAGGVEK